MKCLYLSNTLIDGKSAASNHITEMITGLKKNEIEVELVSACSNLKDISFKKNSIKLWFPKFRGGWKFFQIQFFILCFLKKNINYDFIYFRLSPSKTIAYSLNLIKTKKIMELNGLEILNNKNSLFLFKIADKIFVSNEATKNLFLKNHSNKSKKISINSNVGIDSNKFINKNKEKCREELNLERKTLILTLVSGFQEHHDFDTVLQAFSLFNKENPSSLLILIGDGPRKNEIDKKVKNLFCTNKILLTGSLYIEDVINYINATDICLNIMHEWKLKHGNLNAQKTYEYMALGRPVIETCITENFIPEWGHEMITIIPPESIKDLSEAIKLIHKNYDFYEKKSLLNQNFIKENYTWEKISANVVTQVKNIKKI